MNHERTARAHGIMWVHSDLGFLAHVLVGKMWLLLVLGQQRGATISNEHITGCLFEESQCNTVDLLLRPQELTRSLITWLAGIRTAWESTAFQASLPTRSSLLLLSGTLSTPHRISKGIHILLIIPTQRLHWRK